MKVTNLTSRSILLLAALSVAATAQTNTGDLVQPGQITLDPQSSGPVVLTLQGQRADTGSADYGLTLSYEDAATGSVSTGIFRIQRLNGQYQWQLSTSDTQHPERLAMQLGNDHSLKLTDPADPTNTAKTIELRPGPASETNGIFVNGQQVLTKSASSLSIGGPNFTVTSTGKVGIGTSTPAYPLVVKSGSAGFEFNAATQTLGTGLGTSGGLWLNSGASASAAGTQGGQIFLGGITRGDAAQGAIQFLSNGTEYMRIDGNASGHVAGNVGIGTATPTQKLDVNGTIVSSATVYPNFQFNSARRITFGEADPQTADTGNVVQFGSGLTPSRNMTLIISKSGLDSGFLGNNGSSFIIGEQSARPIIFKNNMSYASGDLLASGSERMRISASGDVGIGTPTPAGRLDVQGGFSFFNGLRLKGDDLHAIYNGNNPLSLTVNNGLPITFNQYPSGEKMRVAANGNVGIGTANPLAKLDVAGDARVSGTLSVNGVPVVTNSATATAPGGNAAAFGLSTTAQGYNQFAVGQFNLLQGTSAYNNNPADPLFVVGNGADADHRSNAMIVTRDGKMGIGTASPQAKLDVAGPAVFQGNSTNNGGTTVALKTTGGAQGLLAGLSFYPTFQNNNTDSGPRRAADIVAGYQGGAWGNEYLALRVGRNNAGNVTNDIQALTDEKVRVLANGNVGIGTATPQTKLDVAGDARFSGRVRVAQQGDLSMGAFTSEPNP